jgi:hypothetical protein
MALPTASDNPFTSLLITEGTEPAAPAAGKKRLYVDSTSHTLKMTDSSGNEHDTELGRLLAYKNYGPDTIFLNAGNATSMTAIDTTNLRLVIPASFPGGDILIRLSCLCANSSTQTTLWGVMEGATVKSQIWLANSATFERRNIEFILPSVAAGTHNYDWAYMNVVGSTLSMYASGLTAGTNHWGLATMTAWAAS